MRLFYNDIVCAVVLMSYSCCLSMDQKDYISVVTVDQKSTAFKRSHIKDSLVLNVLYESQKKTDYNFVVIPQACNMHDNIAQEDLFSLHNLLENQDDAFASYMQKLVKNRQLFTTLHATHVLGAYKQLVSIINYVYCDDIGKHIGSYVTGFPIKEFIVKQILRKQDVLNFETIPRKQLSFMHHHSDKYDEFFYIPSAISSYKENIIFDGISPFKRYLDFFNSDDEHSNGYIKAWNSVRQWYITVSDRDEVVLWKLRKNTLDIFDSMLLGDNYTQPIYVVSDYSKECTIIIMHGQENNLYYWDINDDNYKNLVLDKDVRTFGKVIMNNKGSHIIFADKNNNALIVWGIKNNIIQPLEADYKFPIMSMLFTKNDTALWVCSGSTLFIWHITESGNFELSKTIHLNDTEAVISRLHCNEKSGRIVVGRADGKLNIICMDTYKEIGCLQGHNDTPINGCLGSEYGDIIISLTNGIDKNLIIWDLTTKKPLMHLIDHPGATAIAVTPDMRYILSQSPMDIRLWQVYDDITVEQIDYLMRKLLSLNCYYNLYYIYKMQKNGYKIDESKIKELISLFNCPAISKFLKELLSI
ncbi:MAG TPA: hypothetical protein VLB80_03530 [Candidatus Babeliales bacterium]|nr:hypothetical protein [Candidatus Babeliales bacterium]